MPPSSAPAKLASRCMPALVCEEPPLPKDGHYAVAQCPAILRSGPSGLTEELLLRCRCSAPPPRRCTASTCC